MKHFFLFSLVACSLVFTSCKKEQPPMAASNNCDCAKEVSADFKMGEKFGGQFLELDTIAMPVNYNDGNPSNFDFTNDVLVYFSANIENAFSYEWHVGSNSNVQTTREFSLFFSDTVGTIPVRLIVHAKPNTICFPNDDGVDTIVKYLTIRNVDPDPLAGTYYGYNTNDPGNYFTVKIDTATHWVNGFGNRCSLSIYNLPNGNTKWEFLGDELGSTTRCFVGAGDASQPYTGGFILYDDNGSIFAQRSTGIYDPATNQIQINYYSAPVINSLTLGTPFPKRTFIGKKL